MPLWNESLRKTEKDFFQFMTKNFEESFPSFPMRPNSPHKSRGKRFFVFLTAHLSLFEVGREIQNSGENQGVGRVNSVFDTVK